jgi:DNA-directed RNA polymerase subunit RPC12/RpoP
MKYIKPFFDYIKEQYGLIKESSSYMCMTCLDSRLEHEEYEDDPNEEGIRCSNCGDCNWEMEH